jgi:hypothetical protein
MHLGRFASANKDISCNHIAESASLKQWVDSENTSNDQVEAERGVFQH